MFFFPLQKSQQKGKKVVKMLDIAREWGTKILTPTQLMNELKRMKQPIPVQPEKSPEESERHYRGMCQCSLCPGPYSTIFPNNVGK